VRVYGEPKLEVEARIRLQMLLARRTPLPQEVSKTRIISFRFGFKFI
jgi:hypothetical protein